MIAELWVMNEGRPMAWAMGRKKITLELDSQVGIQTVGEFSQERPHFIQLVIW